MPFDVPIVDAKTPTAIILGNAVQADAWRVEVLRTDVVLMMAREFIRRGWCRRVYWRKRFIAFGPWHHCIHGALIEAGQEQSVDERTWLATTREAANRLRMAVGTINLMTWNDRKGRTKAEVLAAFDRALAA